MDALAALGMIVLCAVVVAYMNDGGLVAWLREEWRLMRLDTWDVARPQLTGGTIDEPRVKAMDERLRAASKEMQERGDHIAAGRAYRPALTKPVRNTAPCKVVPMRRRPRA